MAAGAVLAATLASLASPTGAVITRTYPLKDILADCDSIRVATVRPSTGGKRREFVHSAVLKGRAGWKSATVDLTRADDHSQTPILAQRLKKGRSVVLFSRAGKFTLGFVEGTWFRLAPAKVPAKRGAPTALQFVHLELYLRRTFHGSTAELRKVVADALAGKSTPPEADVTVKPGYGD